MSANPYDIAALALAPIAAFASLGLGRRWQLLLAFLVVSAVGWALLLASVSWSDTHLVATFDELSNISREQIRTLNTDGATKSALFLFGFPLSLLYAFAWFAAAFLARQVKRRLFHA